MIPERTKETIDLYVSHGCEPGGFMYAVLTNDLFGAIARADVENRANLQAICQYIYNDICSDCWGSKEKVQAWMKQKRAEREIGNG